MTLPTREEPALPKQLVELKGGRETWHRHSSKFLTLIITGSLYLTYSHHSMSTAS